MVWLTDSYGMRRWLNSQGWRRVALSQRVWERCVVVPDGVRGQSEDIRIWDLLCFLGDMLESSPAAYPLFGNRVGFLASVVNDNRDECDADDDDQWWPSTRVSLVARAGLAADGMPCLLVTFLGKR